VAFSPVHDVSTVIRIVALFPLSFAVRQRRDSKSALQIKQRSFKHAP